jgi:hypothetical protein
MRRGSGSPGQVQRGSGRLRATFGRVISGSGRRGGGPPGSGDDHPTFDTTVAHQARIYNY